jgi:hypothetical protein
MAMAPSYGNSSNMARASDIDSGLRSANDLQSSAVAMF